MNSRGHSFGCGSQISMKPKARVAMSILLFVGIACAAFGESRTRETPLPQHLSATGLFVNGSTTVRAENLSFTPQYPLWSDGATKRRWIYQPRGTFVDASRADAWEMPPGTRLWKEFSVGERRVETRLIERQQDGSWRYATYVWREDGSDALLAPAEGIASLQLGNARNYTIPSEPDCRACHEGAAGPALGFSALQLSPDRDPLAPHAEPVRAGDVDLRTLVARGLVRNLPQALIEKPPRIVASSANERAVLGYLHGNCGYCHGDPDSGASIPIGVQLVQQIADPTSADTVLRSLISADSRFRMSGAPQINTLIAPGDAGASVLPMRMRTRDPRVQMPPLGTAMPDAKALALIERWINHDLKSQKEPSE